MITLGELKIQAKEVSLLIRNKAATDLGSATGFDSFSISRGKIDAVVLANLDNALIALDGKYSDLLTTVNDPNTNTNQKVIDAFIEFISIFPNKKDFYGALGPDAMIIEGP